jgi:hypothetical protein
MVLDALLPPVAFGLLRSTNRHVLVDNVEPEGDATNGGIAVGSKGNLTDKDLVAESIAVVDAKRNLDGLAIGQAKGPLLKDHAQLIVDNVLRTELVVPSGRAPHLKRNAQLVVLRKIRAPPVPRDSSRDVADELVKVFPLIEINTEEFPERIVAIDGVETLLMHGFNVDIRRDSVSLSLGVRQPRLLGAGSTRIVNATATLAERTAKRE